MTESKRKTAETDISIQMDIRKEGKSQIETGVNFFDHMLTLFAKHSGFDLKVTAKGDVEVDCHHTVEDVGIVLGKVFKEELAEKIGIKRYASLFLPMDEALVLAAVDISGRPFLACDLPLDNTKIGDFDGEMTEEFLRAFAFNAGITLHIKYISGSNKHHIVEAVFKALGRVLREAVTIVGNDIPSTKGSLEG